MKRIMRRVFGSACEHFPGLLAAPCSQQEQSVSLAWVLSLELAARVTLWMESSITKSTGSQGTNRV